MAGERGCAGGGARSRAGRLAPGAGHRARALDAAWLGVDDPGGSRRSSELMRDLRTLVADPRPVDGVVLPCRRASGRAREVRLRGVNARVRVEVIEPTAVDVAAVIVPVAAAPEPMPPE